MNTTLSSDERLLILQGLSVLEPNYITGKLISQIKRSRIIMCLFMVKDNRRVEYMERVDKPPVDLARLNAVMEREPQRPVPPSHRLETYAPKRNGGPHVPTALTGIAATITKLTWKEAEAMGAGIAAKMNDGGSLTAAIQAWADENTADL